MYSVIRFCVLVDSAPIIQMREECENDRIKYFVKRAEYRHFHDLAGEPVEFERNIHVGRTRIQLLKYIHETLAEESVTPSQFKGRIIFMSMYNDMNWWQNLNEDECRQNAIQVSSYAKNFKPGRWSFLGSGDEEKWYGILVHNPLGELELNSGDYDARIRQERASTIQNRISTCKRRAPE